jgi:hypothetical protein
MLLLKGEDEQALRGACAAVDAAARRLPKSVAVSLDARPVHML